MNDGLPVDAVALRDEVKSKYRAVAVEPHGVIISTPDARLLGVWAMRRRSSTHCRTTRLRLSPVSATRSRWAHYARTETGWASAVCRYRERQGDSGRRAPASTYGPTELPGPAVRGLAAYARAKLFCRCPDRPAG
jgi:hypothetical protein